MAETFVHFNQQAMQSVVKRRGGSMDALANFSAGGLQLLFGFSMSSGDIAHHHHQTSVVSSRNGSAGNQPGKCLIAAQKDISGYGY